MADPQLAALHIDQATRRWDTAVGVGGLGSGEIVLLDGNATLGREESRAGRFLDARDYCKLHIVGHYLQTLLSGGFRVVPIGLVGTDDTGRRLIEEMRLIGMETAHVRQVVARTLQSVCFVYPDGSGGNVTSSDSASSLVDGEMVGRELSQMTMNGGRMVAIALPEVPLDARASLLDDATELGAYRAASFTTEEIGGIDPTTWRRIDLLAINVDEAHGLVGMRDEPPDIVAAGVARRFEDVAPDLRFAVTAGQEGSWIWDGRKLGHQPAVSAGEVVGTAGAGDAFLAGLLVGLAGQLDLGDAHLLAALVAAVAVTSPHAIHPRLDRAALRAAADRLAPRPSSALHALLRD
jgi:ribokinase